jgi:hypothetical protein
MDVVAALRGLPRGERLRKPASMNRFRRIFNSVSLALLAAGIAVGRPAHARLLSSGDFGHGRDLSSFRQIPSRRDGEPQALAPFEGRPFGALLFPATARDAIAVSLPPKLPANPRPSLSGFSTPPPGARSLLAPLSVSASNRPFDPVAALPGPALLLPSRGPPPARSL